MKRSVIFVALAILQITKHTSAQNTTVSSNTTVTHSTPAPPPVPSSASPQSPSGNSDLSKIYLTLPRNLTAALGDKAEFWCGVPKSSEGLTLSFYGHAHNYTLSCPSGHMEDIPQALEGICVEHLDELLAAFLLKGTSLPDNGTRVVCQRRGHPAAPAAHLHVYDNGSGNALLIGLAIGGFFGILTVFGLMYLMLTRSERLQICFRGKRAQPDDLTEIVDNIEPTASSKPTLTEKARDL